MYNKCSISKAILPLLLMAAASAVAQTSDVTTVALANSGPIVAPGSLAASWGANFTSQTTAAPGLPLGASLGGLQVNVTDVEDQSLSSLLYFTSPGQINFVVSESAVLGVGSVNISGGSSPRTGEILVSNVAPTLITANAMGMGTAAGQTVNVSGGQAQIGQTVDAINLGGANSQVYLMLYGSGIRNHSANPVIATVNDVKVPVLYAGPQSQFPGLDQVNIGPLPGTLAGSGVVDLQLCVDGVPANLVTVTIQ